MGGQVFSHLQASRAPSRVTWDFGRQVPSLWMSPFPSFIPIFMSWAWHHVVWKIPLVSLGSAVPAVSPPNILCTPSLFGGVGDVRSSGLEAVQALMRNNVRQVGVINSVLVRNLEHSTVQSTMKTINSIPVKMYTKLNSGYYLSHLFFEHNVFFI